MVRYNGIIPAEMLREIEDREYSLLLREQLAEIDNEIKCAVMEDPTIYHVDLEYEEVYDETLESLVAAGYTVKVRVSEENDDYVVLTVSWGDDEEDDDCCCCCDDECC